MGRGQGEPAGSGCVPPGPPGKARDSPGTTRAQRRARRPSTALPPAPREEPMVVGLRLPGASAPGCVMEVRSGSEWVLLPGYGGNW